MSTTQTKIRGSVSQFKKADMCERQYWYEYGPLKRKSPPTPNQQLGTDVHDVLENHIRHQTPLPESRVGRIASAGLKHLKDLGSIEAERDILIPMGDDGHTIICRVDMTGLQEPYIGDHKTTKDFKWAKSVYEVRNDVQLLTYAYAAYHETKPADVTVELIYYKTVGLPVSMKVSAVVPWSDIERNWHELTSKLPRLVEIRSDLTGESIVGNSAACGNYGGCYHADVCPFSPKALQKGITTDRKDTSFQAPTKTRKNKKMHVTDQGKKLQGSLGIGRLLPKGAPQEVEHPQALLKATAQKLGAAVEFNGSITPEAAFQCLERMGVAPGKIDEVLALANLDFTEDDMIAEASPEPTPVPVSEPTPAPAPIVEEPTEEPLPVNGAGRPLYEKVDKQTKASLAYELKEVYPEGADEQEARAYCESRIPENRNINDKRWAEIVELSDFTLDGGTLYPLGVTNPEGYTLDPEEGLTGAELDRRDYEVKTGKAAPVHTPEAAQVEAPTETPKTVQPVDAVACSSRLIVLVDCLVESAEQLGEVKTLSQWAKPYQDRVVATSKKPYWDRMQYRDSEKETVGLVVSDLFDSHPTGVLVVDTASSLQREILDALRTLDSVTIIRGVR